MKSTDVGPAEDFPEGEKRSAQIDGSMFLLVRVKGKVRAVDMYCPHQHSSLLFGTVTDGKIVCRTHRATFDLESGKALSGPSLKDLPTFETEEREGRVYVRT
ncbi:MAG: 3-phenylpropionate dioxygenase ferredoxin subunit [Methanomassiliicoccales archaeon PtaU1.Bin124]|nr:MAG: 3-phenylpropionate dioxygenase ferredoxin subunit [Methanomassiliicoccales archaeon PtaU1.Bin124]